MRNCAALLLFLSAVAARADQLTPSGSAVVAPAAGTAASVSPSLTYPEASAQVGAVIPLTLNRSDQVVKHSYNFAGARDASFHCEVGFGPQALVFTGEVHDEQPLVQNRLRPLMEDWWQITYGADGAEIYMDDPTSATRRLKLLFNFSSAGTTPQLEVLQSPTGYKGNPAAGSLLELEELPDAARLQGLAGFRFRAVLPLEKISEPAFFTGPLRITTRLHDLDGEYSTYLMMQDVLEKP